jgi:hypothetical protein
VNLDDIERRARLVVDKDESAGVGTDGLQALVLARALLSILPVIRAAQSWRDERKFETPMRGRAREELERAIDRMREGMR